MRPQTIGAAGKLQNAWFQGGSASAADGARSAARPDGVLVSAETVNDFQLRPGDLLRLRLQDGRTKQLQDRPVPLRRASPRSSRPRRRDSFLVANASYVARATGSDAVGAFLVQTDGSEPARRRRRGSARAVGTERAGHRHRQTSARSSAPTSPPSSCPGLTKVELGFALVLAVAASGLALGARLPGAPAHVRDRRRARRPAAPARRRSCGASRCSSPPAAWSSARSIAAGISRDAREGPHRRLRPAARRARGPVGLPRRASAALAVRRGRRGGRASTLRALRRPAIEELRDL